MKAKRTWPWVMPITFSTLCFTSMAFAQDATDNANSYQEMGWLFLALLLGFSVVARRASRLDSTSSATSNANPAIITQDRAQATPAEGRPMRLLYTPAQEVPAQAANRANIELPTSKKTA